MPANFFWRAFSVSAKALFGILSGKAVKARSCCGASFCFENPTFTARRYAVTLYGAENGVKSVGKTFCKGKSAPGAETRYTANYEA